MKESKQRRKATNEAGNASTYSRTTGINLSFPFLYQNSAPAREWYRKEQPGYVYLRENSKDLRTSRRIYVQGRITRTYCNKMDCVAAVLWIKWSLWSGNDGRRNNLRTPTVHKTETTKLPKTDDGTATYSSRVNDNRIMCVKVLKDA